MEYNIDNYTMDDDNYIIYVTKNGTLVPYVRYTDGDLTITEE